MFKQLYVGVISSKPAMSNNIVTFATFLKHAWRCKISWLIHQYHWQVTSWAISCLATWVVFNRKTWIRLEISNFVLNGLIFGVFRNKVIRLVQHVIFKVRITFHHSTSERFFSLKLFQLQRHRAAMILRSKARSVVHHPRHNHKRLQIRKSQVRKF